MRIQKVIIGFSSYSDALVIQFVETVLLSMTGNPNFIAPQPALALISTALEDFQEAISAAEMGSATERAVREQKREELLVLMKQLALYIQLVTGDDVAKMLSSGFGVTRVPSPIGPLPKPAVKIAAFGRGKLKVTLRRLYGAKDYLVNYKEVEAEEWKVMPSTKTRIVLSGLESGHEYVVRVLPVGASEVRTYSDEVSSYVL